MQRFSVLAQGGAPDADALLEQLFSSAESVSPLRSLAWLALSQMLVIVAYWIVSNVVARERSSFGRAVKVWALQLFTGFGVAVLFAVGIAFAAARESTALLGAILLLTLFLLLVVMFGIPKKMYGFGLGRTLLFVFLALLVQVAGSMAFARLLPTPSWDAQATVMRQVWALSPAERKKFFEGLQRRRGRPPAAAESANFAIAADRSKSIDERHAALAAVYEELEARRKTLPADDQAAADAFSRDSARYQELLRQLQADAAGPQ